MDAVALREVPRLSRRIDLLSALANVAVLLGLLGTVSGMIAAFAAVANLPPAEKSDRVGILYRRGLECHRFRTIGFDCPFLLLGWVKLLVPVRDR